jgi:hypothetical protein
VVSAVRQGDEMVKAPRSSRDLALADVAWRKAS